MFLIIGLFMLTALMLTSLYYFIFRKFHYLVNVIVLLLVSILPLMVLSLHTIFLSMMLLSIGLFVVHLAKKARGKNKV